MELVINNCFGGFGLSAKAENLYATKKGFSLYRYKQTKHEFRDGVDEYVRVDDNDDSMFTHTYTKDHGDKFNKYPGDETYWYSGDIKREDPILIEVVKELGDKANGQCASLKIVDVPDGIDYEISEYDGNEHVAECHRTWY